MRQSDRSLYGEQEQADVIRFIIGSLEMGGTEKHLVQLLPRLKKKGLSPLVITLTHKGMLAVELERSGIKVLSPHPLIRMLQRIPVIRGLVGLPLTIIYLVANYIRYPADLTCFYLPMAYYLGSAAAIISRETKTVMFRRSLNNYQNISQVIPSIEKYLHKKQMLIVGNSRAVIKELLLNEGVPVTKARLVYNGIDSAAYFNTTESRISIRRRLGLEKDEVVLSIVANLLPYKGHEDIIDALAIIKDRIGRPWTLLCVGTGDEIHKQALGKKVQDNKLVDHVRWLGKRNDIPEILSACDIGLIVSHQEGFSNAILEGMAAGLPMIVTDVGGNVEAVLHEINGLVVKPHDPAGLGEAILRLMNEPDEAKRFGIAGRERVRECFTIEKCVSEYLELFEEIRASCRLPAQGDL